MCCNLPLSSAHILYIIHVYPSVYTSILYLSKYHYLMLIPTFYCVHVAIKCNYDSCVLSGQVSDSQVLHLLRLPLS